MIVKTVSYEVSDPTLDQQVVDAEGKSGADVVLLVTLPKFAAQSIRKIHDIGWSLNGGPSWPIRALPSPAR